MIGVCWFVVFSVLSLVLMLFCLRYMMWLDSVLIGMLKICVSVLLVLIGLYVNRNMNRCVVLVVMMLFV